MSIGQASHLTIPCHWNKETADTIISYNKYATDLSIAEIYGALPTGPIGHGRAPNTVNKIKAEDAINFRNYIESKNLKFSYLLNAPDSAMTKDKEIDSYLDWIVNDFGADAIVVASFDLMKHIRERYKEAKIFISTIAGVKNWSDLQNYLPIEPSRVILHHDSNRDFNDLQTTVDKAKENNIDVELMLTESCLRGCPVRDEHYEWVGEGHDDHKFHVFCNTEKLLFPREFLKANFIRPEDVKIYQEMGVNHFKITGRSKNPSWLPEVAKAYIEKEYDGNLVRLFGVDPKLLAEEWILINNRALNGFLENFPRSGIKSEEDRFSDEWAVKLFVNGDLQIRSNEFSYEIVDGRLHCEKMDSQVYDVSADIGGPIQIKRLNERRV